VEKLVSFSSGATHHGVWMFALGLPLEPAVICSVASSSSMIENLES
jgi:hypothetical protein